MSWFKRKSSRPPEIVTPPVIKFLGEQDGSIERDLKSRFIDLFDENPTIRRAYLVRTDYGDATGANVALCVKSSAGEDMALVSDVFAIFAEMFGIHEHLDVLFVRDDQEQQLRAVCTPFYERPSSPFV
jgi:SseB protein C-terminal domain